MSFLVPERPPVPVLAVAGLMALVGALAMLDGFGIIDLHGFALPMLGTLGIVAALVLRRQRAREQEAQE